MIIEDLFFLLNQALEESDLDKKVSIMEDYSKKIQKILSTPQDIQNLSKEEIKKLNDLHEKVLKEFDKAFLEFKYDVRDFKKKSKGIKAYLGELPKRIGVITAKKG